MNKVIVGLAGLIMCFVWSVLCAQESGKNGPLEDQKILTIKECIQKVLSHYPLLKKQYAKAEEGEADKSQTVSLAFPRLQALTSATSGNDPVYVFGALLKQNEFSQNNFDIPSLNDPDARTNYNFGLQAELPLFNAFQTVSKIRVSKFKLDSTLQEEKQLMMEARLFTLEAYFGVLLYERLLALNEEVLEETQKDIQQAQDLKEKGVVLGADFFAAKVVADGMIQTHHRLQSQLQNAQITLNVLMGEDVNSIFSLQGKLPENIRENRDLAEWISSAFLKRSDLQSIHFLIKAQEIECFREKASRWPRLSAFGKVEENTRDWSEGGENFLVGIKGEMDLLDPTYSSRIRKSNAILEQWRQEEVILRDNIKKAMVSDWSQYNPLVSNAPLVVQSFDDARESVKLTAKLYEEGRKSIVDLIEIRKSYLETGRARYELLFHAQVQYAKLLFLSGALEHEQIAEIADRLENES